jgi:hypothetical protein
VIDFKVGKECDSLIAESVWLTYPKVRTGCDSLATGWEMVAHGDGCSERKVEQAYDSLDFRYTKYCKR